jgi:hypothetical protein
MFIPVESHCSDKISKLNWQHGNVYKIYFHNLARKHILKINSRRGKIMKKAVSIFCFTLLFPMVLAAQSWIWHVTQTNFQGPVGTAFDPYLYVENISGQDLSIRLIRTVNNLPAPDWSSSMCNAHLCFPPEVDTLLIPDPISGIPPIAPGDSAEFHLQVNSSFTTPGIAYITIRLENMNNPTEFEETDFVFSTMPNAVEPSNHLVSGSFRLLANYPNPFNPTTTIPFEVGGSRPVDVSLTIYNSLGQKVTVLVNEKLHPGIYETSWFTLDQFGKSVPSGIYFYELRTNDFLQMRKMLFIK